MKTYRIFTAAVAIFFVLAIAVVNVVMMNGSFVNGGEYRVEIERAALAISQGKEPDNSHFEYIRSIEKANEFDNAFFDVNGEYAIRIINGVAYRFDYQIVQEADRKTMVTVNVILGITALTVIGVLIYIEKNIIKPFHRLTDVPYQLSKGNLIMPVKEMKSRYFGRFHWGLDLLRDKLEQQKAEEMRLQKEKKTLILSLSHDINSPLSAIKLYAKALSKNLYRDRERQREIAENINKKADEIEAFVSQIVTASNEDFLHIEVSPSEMYLSELMDKIKAYYTEQLELNRTDFVISEYGNCILKGDLERSVEVLQNIIENSIKYGDGRMIRIDFSDEEDCKLVTVTNSGGSLSESELPHIFESFWRGSNAKNRSGSGLGLYICRQIMLKMDGEIFAKIDGEYMKVTAVFRKS